MENKSIMENKMGKQKKQLKKPEYVHVAACLVNQNIAGVGITVCLGISGLAVSCGAIYLAG